MSSSGTTASESIVRAATCVAAIRENERIEIVKSAIGRQHHSSAFAGVGIGIVEMLPAAAVFWAAVKGDAVGFRRQSPAGKSAKATSRKT